MIEVMQPQHICRCVESAVWQQRKTLSLDREAGIVRGVKILGWSGKGGARIYQRRAVEEALPLYDGVVVNLNHVKVDESDFSHPNRSVTERFGRILNPRIEADGLYGDLKFNKRHWWADTFIGWVESDPGAIGLSHDAILQGPIRQDGKRSIESIPKVFSVDIVADPGSTKGLHENMAQDANDPALNMDDLKNEGSPEDHLCAYIVSLIKDKSLSVAERKRRVLKAFKLLENELEAREEEEEEKEEEEETEQPATPDMTAKGKESMALTDDERAELDALRAEKARRAQEQKAREKCRIAGLDDYLITDTFIDVMCRAQESQWERLISDRRLQADHRPKSTMVAKQPGGGITVEEFEKFLFGKVQ